MTSPRAHAVFDTAIGACAVAWSDAGLTGIWLPAATREALQRSVRTRSGNAPERAPPREVAEVIESIVRLLAGEPVAFDAARLDLGGTADFDARVYAATRAIGFGTVLTYG